MLKSELLEIIANGENSGIEFKRDDVRREQQQRLFESGGMLHVEVLPVMGTSLENIDTDRLDYYLRSIIKDPEVPATDSEWVERLLGLGLMAKDGMGNAACSVAGLLCFGITPRRSHQPRQAPEFNDCHENGGRPALPT